MKKHFPWFAVFVVAVNAFAGQQSGQDAGVLISPEHPAIEYFKEQPADPIARLAKRIESGEVTLTYSPGPLGYLPSLLKNLDINTDSQLLVFSKTSFQAPKISPHAPRAVFFNDSVFVGSVQHSDLLELAALDPKQGVVFYTMSQEERAKPTFSRNDSCLQCHRGAATLDVPGIVVGSSYVTADGKPSFGAGFTAIDDRIPLEQRWGGWYVTGTTGKQTHLGNAVAHDREFPRELDTTESMNVTSLEGKFDPVGYMAPTSDVVALMVLEHQTRMTNLMTNLGWRMRIDQADGKVEQDAAAINAAVEDLVTYMLFADEAPLKGRIEGTSGFMQTFQKRGPRDKVGRSLRDFDLKTRMFRYPLSYMIYSEAFDTMPVIVRDRVYRRLYDVLTGKDTSERYARISATDRSAVLEILRDTKKGLPEYWNRPTATQAAQEVSGGAQ
jgi:hypothetical protein